MSTSTKIVISIVIVVIVIGAGVLYLNNSTSSKTSNTTGQVAGVTTNTSRKTKTGNNPKAAIEKSYPVSALDMTGKVSKNKVTMVIKNAEKTQEILIKGNPATAQNDSSFLVMQIDLKNPSNERLVVSPLDLIRLVIDDQKRAAEIYTEELTRVKGSVVVEPDSTKVTRIGFVLTPEIAKKPLKLQIGEVNAADKQVIAVSI